MDYKGIKKRTYKELKKEIVKDTALNVCYYPGVINKIDPEILLDTLKEIATNGWINENTSRHELANMLITESVRNMSYQEFKEIANNFFSFVPDDNEQYQKVQPIEITRHNYEYLVNNTEKAFGLEKQLEKLTKEINSLDNKIQTLETSIVENKNKVIGIDLDNEEILLLKTPTNSYIDGDFIKDDNVITNFSIDSGEKEIINYLCDEYIEIHMLYKEYILNNDTYKGNLYIDYDNIKEIDYNDIPIHKFTTHKDYYIYAIQFDSFAYKYKDYDDYIDETYNSRYSMDINNLEEDFLYSQISQIDKILEKYDKKLIVDTIKGYCQGEEWTVGYLADKEDDIKNIENYIQHDLGAYVRGSLTELEVISFEALENGVFSGEVETVYYIDNDLLYSDELSKVKEIYPELENFKEIEEAKELDKQRDNNIEQTKGLSI